jgi:hypothetical protein
MGIPGAWIQPTVELDGGWTDYGGNTYFLFPEPPSGGGDVLVQLKRVMYVPGGFGAGDYDHPFGAARASETVFGSALNNVGWYPDWPLPSDGSWANGLLNPWHLLLEWDDPSLNAGQQAYVGEHFYDDAGNFLLDRTTTWGRDPASLVAGLVEYENAAGDVSSSTNNDKVQVLRWTFRAAGGYSARHMGSGYESHVQVSVDSFGKRELKLDEVDPDDAEYDSIRWQVFLVPRDAVTGLDETANQDGAGLKLSPTPSTVDVENDSLRDGTPILRQERYNESIVNVHVHWDTPNPGYIAFYRIDWGDGNFDTGDNQFAAGSGFDFDRGHAYRPPSVPYTYNPTYTVTQTVGSTQTTYGPYDLGSVTFNVDTWPTGSDGVTIDPSALLTGWESASSWWGTWFESVVTEGVKQIDVPLRGWTDHQDFVVDHPAADADGLHRLRLAVCHDWIFRPTDEHAAFPDWTLTSACDDTPDTVWRTGPQDDPPRLIFRPTYIPSRWRHVYNSVTATLIPAVAQANTPATLTLVPEWAGREVITGVSWTIDWGDGTPTDTAQDQLTFTHEFPRPGYFVVHFTGTSGIVGTESERQVSGHLTVEVTDYPDLADRGGSKRPGFYGRRS